MSLRSLAPVLVIVALGGALIVRAQEPDPLVALGSSDPIALARAVDRIGDEGVIARLTEETAADVRLAAIRACPGLREPERALEPLAAIAIGRDPDLAPAAARAILEVARELDPQELDAREVMREELVPAREAIQRIVDDETARADLRRAAGIAIEQLAHLGIGAPPA